MGMQDKITDFFRPREPLGGPAGGPHPAPPEVLDDDGVEADDRTTASDDRDAPPDEGYEPRHRAR